MILARDEYGDLVGDMYCLGQIPDFQGLLPKSNDAGVPVYEVTDTEIAETGSVLKGFKEKREYRGVFENISKRIVNNLNYA
jgi:hypothetical protein